jgi:diguanylate cyclase (GGDEF)-like protein/PAS domain S-box-containing protein
MSHKTEIDAEAILEESPDGVVVVDGTWRVCYANRAVEGITSCARTAIMGEEIWTALPTLAGTAAEAELRRAGADSCPSAFEHRDAAADRYYVIYAHPDARTGGLVIYLRDLTLQKLAEDAASTTARKYRMLMEQASDGILVMDRTTRCIEVNARLCAMLGYTSREILARHYRDLIHPSDLAATPVRLDELLSTGSVLTERLLLRKDGGGIVVEVGASVLADGRILTLFRDITARKQSEELLRVQSVLDELTGVYNRRGFIQAAERELRIVAQPGRQPVFLLMADLDNLKLINDTYGHAAGDDALVAAADVLRDVVRASDVVGRWGGDEFAVFVSRGADAALDVVRARITRRLERENAGDRPYIIALSLGAAFVYADEVTTLEGLIAQADAALYADKRSRPAERQWRR